MTICCKHRRYFCFCQYKRRQDWLEATVGSLASCEVMACSRFGCLIDIPEFDGWQAYENAPYLLKHEDPNQRDWCALCGIHCDATWYPDSCSHLNCKGHVQYAPEWSLHPLKKPPNVPRPQPNLHPWGIPGLACQPPSSASSSQPAAAQRTAEAKVAELESNNVTFNDEIAAAKAAIKQAQVDPQRASEDRKVENQEFQKTIADQNTTMVAQWSRIEKMEKQIEELYDQVAGLRGCLRDTNK